MIPDDDRAAAGPEPSTAPLRFATRPAAPLGLPEMLRWLAELPVEFRAPFGLGRGRTKVNAVVADLWETLFEEPPPRDVVLAFAPGAMDRARRAHLRWALAGCRVLAHPELRPAAATEADRTRARTGVRAFLLEDLAALSAVVAADALDADPERREELVRLGLRALGLAPVGETPEEARDRLAQVDSVERRRLVDAAAARERRAREMRELLARRAAEARVGKTKGAPPK
ncbi:MAG: hypothetical protein HYZ53_29570 [Planctomycetes bacterium]|nr:hypothetical protein [Planctomycetota bacterium]